MIFNTLPINIEEVTYLDLPQLHTLSVETFNNTFRHSQVSDNLLTYTNKNYNYGQLASELINSQSHFYFIYFNHKLAGYLKLNVNHAQSKDMGKDSLEIDRIYIRHNYEYIGLENKLIRFAITQAKKYNKKIIWSSVWEHDTSIVHFYNEFGFKSISSQNFELAGTTQKDLVMEATI